MGVYGFLRNKGGMRGGQRYCFDSLEISEVNHGICLGQYTLYSTVYTSVYICLGQLIKRKLRYMDIFFVLPLVFKIQYICVHECMAVRCTQNSTHALNQLH